MKLLFIKQQIGGTSAVEDMIEAALRRAPGLAVDVFNIAEHAYHAARAAPHADREQLTLAAIQRCIAGATGRDYEHVLLLNGYFLHMFMPDFFSRLKHGVKTIVAWQVDDPYYIDRIQPFVRQLDHIFTVDTSTLPVYARHEKRAFYLPLACAPEVHRRHDKLPSQYATDLCFVGVPFRGSARVRLIDEIAPLLASRRSRVIGATPKDSWTGNLANAHLIGPSIVDDFIPITEAVMYYNGAKINLNIHKDSYGHAWDRNAQMIIARSPCERTFCIAGCGGFQLIDASRPDLTQHFLPDEEIVCFQDARDLEAKIRYFLTHEQERRDIAKAAQQRAYRDHTYDARVKTILETIA